jgi:hypothetical protein
MVVAVHRGIMVAIWQRGEQLIEVVVVYGSCSLVDANGEVIMRGGRRALEAWLRFAGYVEVK